MFNFKAIIEKFNSLEKKQKIVNLLLAAVVLVDIILAVVLIFGKKSSSVRLETVASKKISALIALDSPARKGSIADNEYAHFKFTKDQKEEFCEVFEENGTVALTIRVKLNPTKKQNQLSFAVNELPFKFGFLYKDDFTSRGKFIKQIYPDNKRILIQGNEKAAPYTFDVSFAIPRSEDISKFIPEGFFVYSSMRCKILGACVVPCQVGFDVSSQIPFYGFASNGGIIDFTNRKIDFSGTSLVFPVQNTTRGTMPEICVRLNPSYDMKTNSSASVRAEINIGGEKLYVNNVAAADSVVIPTGALKAPFTRLEIINNAECITSILMQSTKYSDSDVVNPITTDPGLILNYKMSNWRTLDYEIFEWDRFDKIIFFDTRNYDVQDRFFRRMAFFVEKEGFKGRLLTDEELEGKHGYNAHDYSAQGMADFFNKATDLNFRLNKEELILRRILLKNGILEEDGNYVKPVSGGIVSISQESQDWLRTSLLAHEGWHTLYFRDEEFRNFVSAVFYTFDPSSQAFLIDYFKSQPNLGYDVNDDYLLKNEFMAYIMQQPLSGVGNYFVHLANRGSVMNYTPNLCAYIRETNARGFEDAAAALNDYVFDKYGIVCGNISLVSR